MKLSDRLETIIFQAAKAINSYEDGSEAVSQNRCVADVGTDHGFVPIRLVEQGAACRAIAMDVRQGPLERAREHILQHGMEAQIETRLGDGLSVLKPGEADTVIIAGMGGELMLKILREGAHLHGQIRHYILSPQSELSLFRHGLETLGLLISDEVMVEEDGKYYVVMTAKPGKMEYGEEYQYRYGDCLIRKVSLVLQSFLEREMSQNRMIRQGLEGQDGEGARRRLGDLEQEYSEMEVAYGAIEECVISSLSVLTVTKCDQKTCTRISNDGGNIGCNAGI